MGTIRVTFKHFCPTCGEPVFIITCDAEIYHCSKCDKDILKGDVKEEKFVQEDGC